jgi:hypothetical protein
VGTKWVLIAQEAKTKLILSHHEGKRDFEDSVELIEDLEKKRDKSTELPIFTSDDWDAYKNALIEVYGVPEQPEYKGRGRPPNPITVPPPDLKYAQVINIKRMMRLLVLRKELCLGMKKKFSIYSNRMETLSTHLT